MSITIMKIIIKFNGWAPARVDRAHETRTWSTDVISGCALTGGGRAIRGGRCYQMRTRSSGGR